MDAPSMVYALLGEVEPRGEDRAANSLCALFDRARRQADDGDAGEPTNQVYFDLNLDPVHALHRARHDRGGHVEVLVCG